MKINNSKTWLLAKIQYIIFYWFSLTGTDSSKTYFNHQLYLAEIQAPRTFKNVFMCFQCCGLYPSPDTLAIAQEVWVNACEPTLMRKLCIISEELHDFFLPMLFKEAAYSLLKQSALSQRNLAIKSSHFYLLGSAWSHGGRECARKVWMSLLQIWGRKMNFFQDIISLKVR